MSDNIVGKDHLDYVKSQITTRQEILGKSTRDSEDITWMSGKDSWVRLMSSVDIADEYVVKYNTTEKKDELILNSGSEFRNQYLNISGYGGPQLSQENILQGGTLNYNTPKFGVSNVLESSPNNDKNYGFGGGEFGLKPMPGITGFSSNTYNKGSLRKAQLTIVAHNTNQFNYLESLYLRLGYTMLLEWGNSKYPITNEDGSTRYSTSSDIASLSLKNEFLYTYDKGSSYFYTRIEELRKQSQGNYDGFLGRVENFSWEFTKEGAYNITLDLISIGSVIESLKLNTNSDSILYTIPSGSSVNSTDEDRPTSLEVAIDILTNTYTTKTTEEIKDLTKESGYRFEKHTIINPIKKQLTTEEATSLGTDKYFYEDIKSITSSNGTNEVETRVMSCNASYGEDTIDYKYYVRLGTLIGFINEKLLLYDADENPSIIQIDGSVNNYCYSNGYSFSGDPSKMVNRLELTIGQDKLNAFPQIEPFHDTLEDGTPIGRIMNLYFERDYLKNLIKSKSDQDGNLVLYDFLKELTITANSLLGGVNKLNIRITQKDLGDDFIVETLEFYEEVPFKKIDTTSVFNIYGFNGSTGEGSFITDFNLKTEITKKLSTQIAIGAQANGRSIGEDSTLFSKWNVGLVDRVIPTKLDFDQIKKFQSQDRIDFRVLQQTYKNYLFLLKDSGQINFKKNLFVNYFSSTTVDGDIKGYGFPNLYLTTLKDEKPTFVKFVTIQKEFFKKVLAWDALRKDIPSPFIGFIPINLSLTMDGLSGIRIFDQLTVNSQFLPSNYTDTLNFIITQLDHKFEGNKWITNIGTQSRPKLFDDRPEIATKDILEVNINDLTDEENRIYEDSKYLDSYFIVRKEVLKKVQSSISTTDNFFTPKGQKGRRMSIDEVLTLLNHSPFVQNKFREFFTNLLKYKGYEFSINSITRKLSDATGVGLNSAHIWGVAIDMSIWEAAPENIYSSRNKLYGMVQTKESADKWVELGIAEIAENANLRWGGTWNTGTWQYDVVHFDVFENWSSGGLSKIARNTLYTKYPGIKSYIKNQNKAVLKTLDLTNFLVIDNDGKILEPSSSEYQKLQLENGHPSFGDIEFLNSQIYTSHYKFLVR